MKLKHIASILLASFVIVSCDDTTDGIGTSLTDKFDQLEITTDTFNVTTQSISANAVLSRNTSGYVGKFKDPETGTDITADFMTQFSVNREVSFPKRREKFMQTHAKSGCSMKTMSAILWPPCTLPCMS